MKKVFSLKLLVILFLSLLVNGCAGESDFFIICILILCLFVIVTYTFILFKRNRNVSSMNNDLEQIISDKTEELKVTKLNFEESLEAKTEELKKQNSIISVNSQIIMSQNTELEKIIKAKVEELCQKDDLMLLNSRLATMGEMIGFIGHQWKQNIYAISLYSEAMKNILMKNGVIDVDTAKEPLDKIDLFIMEMYNNLNDFSDFVKPKKDIEYFSLADAVDETLSLMKDFIIINSVEIIRDNINEISIMGFSNELKQVVMNIIKNAIDVFDELKRKDRVIVISIHRDEDSNYINIKDNAGGITLDNPDGVFDKFYTSKEDGTGLGLYLSRIVIEHRFNGKLEVYNTGGGACFTISIPVFTEDAVF